MDVKHDIIGKIRFDPTISLGHVFTALLFIGGLMATWYDLRSDVNLHTFQIKAIQEAQAANVGELKQELRSNRDEIKSDIKDLRSEIKENERAKKH